VYEYVILQSFLIIAYFSLFFDVCFAWVYEVFTTQFQLALYFDTVTYWYCYIFYL